MQLPLSFSLGEVFFAAFDLIDPPILLNYPIPSPQCRRAKVSSIEKEEEK